MYKRQGLHCPRSIRIGYPGRRQQEGQGKNKSFTSKGKKQVIKKTVDNKQKTAYELTPNDGDAPVYFVVVNDTTLRLVNDSLQEAVSDLNYDIIQVKR